MSEPKSHKWYESKTLLVVASLLFGGSGTGGIVKTFYDQDSRIESLELNQADVEHLSDMVIDLKFDLCMWFAKSSDEAKRECKRERDNDRKRTDSK